MYAVRLIQIIGQQFGYHIFDEYVSLPLNQHDMSSSWWYSALVLPYSDYTILLSSYFMSAQLNISRAELETHLAEDAPTDTPADV